MAAWWRGPRWRPVRIPSTSALFSSRLPGHPNALVLDGWVFCLSSLGSIGSALFYNVEIVIHFTNNNEDGTL